MELWQAFVLGVVEGITELLPVSSTGHLTVAEELIGLDVSDPGVTGFTAFIQVGAIAAVLVYFAKDIAQITTGFFKGIFDKEARNEYEYRMGWYIIVGSIPIVLVGFFAKDLITGPMRSLWFVAGGMFFWSFVLWFAEYAATHQRTVRQITMKDAIFVGVIQSLALIPGVSRSGASTAAGLLRDLDRVAATKLSFYLGIPALAGAGALEAKDALTGSVDLAPLIVGTVVSAIVAYIAVAWLLKFIASHSFMLFVWYRMAFGVVVAGLLLLGVLSPI